MTDAVRPTPASVWAEMREGNERFVTGAPRHPECTRPGPAGGR